jgi:hypothetical protein
MMALMILTGDVLCDSYMFAGVRGLLYVGDVESSTTSVWENMFVSR